MKKGGLKKDLNIFIRSFKLLHSLDRKLFPIVVLHSVLESAKYFITIIFSAAVLDELLGARDIRRFILYVGIIIGSGLILKLICDFLQRIMSAKMRIMRHAMQKEISRKITQLDYEYMDSPDLHNLRQKILEYENMSGTTYQITVNIRNFITSFIQIGTSVAITAGLFAAKVSASPNALVRYINSPFTILLLLVSMAAVVLIQLLHTKKMGDYQVEINESAMRINRKGIYLEENLMGNYNYGKDFRMYDTEELFTSVSSDFVNSFDKFISRFINKVAKSQMKNAVAEGFFSGIIYIFVVLKAFIGAITIGSIMKYAAVIQKLTDGIAKFLMAFVLIQVNCKFLNNILELMDLPDIKYHGTLPVEKRSDHEYEIEFKNVSFKYPSSDEYVLKNLSFRLNIGERLAVVGMNGAGKTTMIKLLCRLYDPTEGEIYLNGIDIKKYDLNEYMSLFSVVFQDFKMFSFSVAQNISASVSPDEKRVGECADMAGLKERMQMLPNGIDTYIKRDFDEAGVDFSGGEMQKMAISRALYKNAPIIILDEPTASLDPISEFEIYSKFDSLVGNKTAIYISHRLSSCRFCHDIMVFDKGEIIQRGTHDELLKAGCGKYSELWQAQAQYYEEEA
ncbi:MAG: ABC transporter ATP-binding protein [Clostridia bacterium]|nr:ABC transporter ATP-binding protein [Clostridia bacterium]